MGAREPPKQACARRAMSSRDCGERLGGRSTCKIVEEADISPEVFLGKSTPFVTGPQSHGPERHGAGISMLRAF